MVCLRITKDFKVSARVTSDYLLMVDELVDRGFGSNSSDVVRFVLLLVYAGFVNLDAFFDYVYSLLRGD